MIGGPYWTVDYIDVDSHTMDESVTAQELFDVSTAKALEYEQEGLIDDLSNLDGAPVFIMSGSIDPIAYPQY